MGLFDDKSNEQDFEKMREESQSLSPETKTEVVPPSPQTSPSQETGVAEDKLAEKVRESKDPDHWVPLPTFLEEKKERQRLEAYQREMAERQARLDERYKIIESRLQPQSQAPDPSTDPLGALQYQDKQQQETIWSVKAKLDQFERQQQEQQQIQQLTMHVSSSEQEFAKKAPDYWDAVEHLRGVRMAQYELAGLTPDQQVQALYADTRNWTMALVNSGKHPAEATYELAKKYGYVAGGDTGVREADNGARAPNRNEDGTFAKAVNPKVEAAKQTLKTVERGQASSKSLGNTAGKAVDDGMPSHEELATMSDEDFDKWTSKKNWKKFWV